MKILTLRKIKKKIKKTEKFRKNLFFFLKKKERLDLFIFIFFLRKKVYS